MNNIATSVIRTVVPAIVGAVVAWLVARGVEVDPATEAQLVAALTALLTGVYYALVRLAERRWPEAGWLLGTAKQPTYVHERELR